MLYERVVSTKEHLNSRVAELIRSTAKIQFSELQRYFAQGVLYVVADHADLIDVACKMAADDKSSIARFIEEHILERVQDDMARHWLAMDTTLWCVVVAPYVLVQRAEQAQETVDE
jgi:hypothetical protein